MQSFKDLLPWAIVLVSVTLFVVVGRANSDNNHQLIKDNKECIRDLKVKNAKIDETLKRIEVTLARLNTTIKLRFHMSISDK